MSLPALTGSGDLPPGIHAIAWTEVLVKFGLGSDRRMAAVTTLMHIHELAKRTGRLSRMLIFGSFVSSEGEPRDVDVALVMNPGFRLEEAPRESQTIFSRADAEARFNASILWIREGMLPAERFEDFIETLMTKRDGTRRGILEVTE